VGTQAFKRSINGEHSDHLSGCKGHQGGDSIDIIRLAVV